MDYNILGVPYNYKKNSSKEKIMPDVEKKFHVIEEVKFRYSKPSYFIKKTCENEQKAREFQEGYQALANLENPEDKTTLYLVSHTLHHKVA